VCTFCLPWTGCSSEWKERAGGGICMQSRIMTRQDYRAQEFIELILKPRGGRVRAAAPAAWNQFPNCVFNQNSARHSPLGGILSRLWSCCYRKRLFGNEPEYIWVRAGRWLLRCLQLLSTPAAARRIMCCVASSCLLIHKQLHRAHIYMHIGEKATRKETKKREGTYSRQRIVGIENLLFPTNKGGVCSIFALLYYGFPHLDFR